MGQDNFLRGGCFWALLSREESKRLLCLESLDANILSMAIQNITKPLRKYVRHLIEARDENLNEADTVRRIISVFADVLGYDRLEDISSEAQMKGKYVDFIIKIKDVTRLLVEAKGAKEKLRDRHIEQAQSYAARNNYNWVLLTNGVEWILFHLTFEDGIEYERAFTIDLSKKDVFKDSAELLAVLHKKAVKSGELEKFWGRTSAVAPDSIGKCLFKESVMRVLRREIRKEYNHLIDPEDLVDAIRDMLTPEAREAIGRIRLRKTRRKKKKSIKLKKPKGKITTPTKSIALPKNISSPKTPPMHPSAPHSSG